MLMQALFEYFLLKSSSCGNSENKEQAKTELDPRRYIDSNHSLFSFYRLYKSTSSVYMYTNSNAKLGVRLSKTQV